MDNEYHKIVLIGDANVGKTSIMNRFVDNTFTREYHPSTGFVSKRKEFRCNNRQIKIELCDTSGDALNKQRHFAYHLKGASGIILVYSETDKQSYDNIIIWLDRIKHRDNDIAKVIVANKCDDDMNGVLFYEDGMNLANTFDIMFMETSAKCDIRINELMNMISNKIVINNDK
jgi:small GTP-binding protein